METITLLVVIDTNGSDQSPESYAEGVHDTLVEAGYDVLSVEPQN